MKWFKRKQKIYKTHLLYVAFPHSLSMLRHDVEYAMPGKTNAVLELGEWDTDLVPNKYKIVDKVDHPSTLLRSIAKLYEDRNPELAEHLNRIAGQIKGGNHVSYDAVHRL